MPAVTAVSAILDPAGLATGEAAPTTKTHADPAATIINLHAMAIRDMLIGRHSVPVDTAVEVGNLDVLPVPRAKIGKSGFAS